MAPTAHWQVNLDIDVQLEIEMVKIGRDVLGRYALLRTNGQEFKVRPRTVMTFTAPAQVRKTMTAPLLRDG